MVTVNDADLMEICFSEPFQTLTAGQPKALRAMLIAEVVRGRFDAAAGKPMATRIVGAPLDVICDKAYALGYEVAA